MSVECLHCTGFNMTFNVKVIDFLKKVKDPHPQGAGVSVKFLRSGEKKRGNAPNLSSRAFSISDFNSKTLYWFVVVLKSRLSRILFLTLRSLQISFRIFILLIFIYFRIPKDVVNQGRAPLILPHSTHLLYMLLFLRFLVPDNFIAKSCIWFVQNSSHGHEKLKFSYCQGISPKQFIGETIGQRFDSTVDKFPDREAYVFCEDNQRVTFAKFQEEVSIFFIFLDQSLHASLRKVCLAYDHAVEGSLKWTIVGDIDCFNDPNRASCLHADFYKVSMFVKLIL